MTDDIDDLTVIVTDQQLRPYRVYDIVEGKFTKSELGCLSFTWRMKRPPDQLWPDQAFMSRVEIFSPQGDRVWLGYIAEGDGNYDTDENGNEYQDCIALGYFSTMYWIQYSGNLGPGITPEGMVSLLISQGYMPHLSTNTGGLLTTGGYNNNYYGSPPQNQENSVAAAILAAAQLGGGSYSPVLISVGTKLGTDNKALIETRLLNNPGNNIRYRSTRRMFKPFTLKRTLPLATEVWFYYKNNSGVVTLYATSMDVQGNNLGIYYTSGTLTPYRRVKKYDITGYGNLPSGTLQPQYAAESMLNLLKRTQIISPNLTLKGGAKVYDYNQSQERKSYFIEPGYEIELYDLYARGQLVGSGTLSGDNSLVNYVYITQMEYDLISGECNITPQQAGDLSDIILPLAKAYYA